MEEGRVEMDISRRRQFPEGMIDYSAGRIETAHYVNMIIYIEKERELLPVKQREKKEAGNKYEA
jgi:hypothetical protein